MLRTASACESVPTAEWSGAVRGGWADYFVLHHGDDAPPPQPPLAHAHCLSTSLHLDRHTVYRVGLLHVMADTIVDISSF